jgi:hypothetical protein
MEDDARDILTMYSRLKKRAHGRLNPFSVVYNDDAREIQCP